MELRSAHRDLSLHHLLPKLSPSNRFPVPIPPTPRRDAHRRLSPGFLPLSASLKSPGTALEHAGGKMVVELVGAFNELTERMNGVALSTSSSRILFKALKLSIPILQSLDLGPDGRSPLSKALSVAFILADLQMDAEVISAGILREVLESGAVSLQDVRNRVSIGTAHLLHESFRVKSVPSKVDILDEESAAALRKFCLTFYDIRAVILDLALKLDTMRHLNYLPRYQNEATELLKTLHLYQQQMISLQVMKVHAPLAHAVGTKYVSLELEDLSFRYLFPYSYLYLDTWLQSHETGTQPLIDIYRNNLLQALRDDPELTSTVEEITVHGRYKSRYSTMKKLLNKGRKPEEVNDILGLRVILKPRSGEEGETACYRAREVVQSLWKEMPNRTKDYIAKPKGNGYRSLHMAVDVSEDGRIRPLMEIQIRTEEMDMLASRGNASHSLYKSGLTNPEEAKRLKAIMLAAAELAALRLQDFPSSNHKEMTMDQRNRVFRLLDKNGDGRISIEELMEVMEELGAPEEDAREMMNLLDANSDGSLSSDEFDAFQKQVEMMRNLEDRDDQYRTMLDEKLHMDDDTTTVLVQSSDNQDLDLDRNLGN